MLALGVGMMFAAMNVKYRDVQHVLPFIVQLWLFVSPIIYPMSMIPGTVAPGSGAQPAHRHHRGVFGRAWCPRSHSTFIC